MSRNFASHDAVVSSVEAAETAWCRGAWAEARDAYNEILRGRLEDLLTEGPVSQTMRLVDLVVIERLADLTVLFGHFQAADRLLQSYVDLAAGAGNLMAADYAALKRVRLAQGAGLHTDALARFEDMGASIGDVHDIRFERRALESWEAERRWRVLDKADQAVLYSRLYLELGQLLAGVGQYGDSLSALARGRYHAGPNAPDLAVRAAVPLELAAAAALLEKGDLVEARMRLEALTGRLDLGSQPDSTLRAMELEGKLALLTGELGEARRLYAGVLRESRNRGFRHASLQASLNLAHVSIYLNQTAVARHLLEGAARDAVELNDPLAGSRSDYLLGLARARGTSLAEGVAIAPPVARIWGRKRSRNKQGRLEAERPDTGPADAPQSSSYLAFFEDMAVGFHARLASEGPRPTVTYLDFMRTVFAATDSELIRLRLRALQGLSDYYLGQFEQASEILEGVAAGLLRIGLRPELWQALRVLGWCRTRLKCPPAEIETLANQTQHLLDSMIRSLPAEDRPILLLTKWTSEEEYLATRIDALIREQNRVEASPWPVRLYRRWALWQQLDELLWFLDRYQDSSHRSTLGVKAGPSDPTAAAPTSLWQRLYLHSPRRAVLSFLVLPDRVFLTCSQWGRIDFGVSPITRLEVREKVGHWHEAVRGEAPPEITADLVAKEMALALQLPSLLDRLPSRVKSLTIVPDDSLCGFPFAAVRLEKEYLVRRFALSISFERHWSRPTTSPESRIVRGTPVTGLLVGVARGLGAIDPLPGVVPELDEVGRWLASCRVPVCRLQDDLADKASVIAALGCSQIAHLACHGVFEVDRPDASGLVLIPVDGRIEVLSIRDLAQADLAGLRQVTLSSCWSADNFVLPGRRLISLPETFFRAGAHSVLGCLWPVNDRTAGEFMRRFYENLATLPRDLALQRVQLDFLEGRLAAGASSLSGKRNLRRAREAERDLGEREVEAVGGCEHPKNWAGFTLSGDPGWLKL
jgi:CHAT domain-containing protein